MNFIDTKKSIMGIHDDSTLNNLGFVIDRDCRRWPFSAFAAVCRDGHHLLRTVFPVYIYFCVLAFHCAFARVWRGRWRSTDPLRRTLPKTAITIKTNSSRPPKPQSPQLHGCSLLAGSVVLASLDLLALLPLFVPPLLDVDSFSLLSFLLQPIQRPFRHRQPPTHDANRHPSIRQPHHRVFLSTFSRFRPSSQNIASFSPPNKLS